MKVTINGSTKPLQTIPICEAVKQSGFFRANWHDEQLYVFNGTGKHGWWLPLRDEGVMKYIDVMKDDKSLVYRDHSIDSITISFPEEE